MGSTVVFTPVNGSDQPHACTPPNTFWKDPQAPTTCQRSITTSPHHPTQTVTFTPGAMTVCGVRPVPKVDSVTVSTPTETSTSTGQDQEPAQAHATTPSTAQAQCLRSK